MTFSKKVLLSAALFGIFSGTFGVQNSTLGSPTAIHAQAAVPMPNRRAAVQQVAGQYPQAFGGDASTLDDRRRLLLPLIAQRLNEIDGADKWRLILRHDRNDPKTGKPPRLTSDALVWMPTREHVDVMSGSGAMWGPHPVITDRDWELVRPEAFPSYATQAPQLPPVPDPVEAMKGRIERLEATQLTVSGELQQLRVLVEKALQQVPAHEHPKDEPLPPVVVPPIPVRCVVNIKIARLPCELVFP